jgi:hypothetical protein
MLTLAAALSILSRYTSALAPDRRLALLEETTTVRETSEATVTLYDPYRAALAYLMSPETLKARAEGSVSETYIDPATVADYLREESASLRLSWPAEKPPVAAPVALNVDLDIRGWNL